MHSAMSMPADDVDRSRGAIPRRCCARRGAERASRGQLKIFLGYASGVGKSFRLFDEGRRRRERGEDVVVAAVQPDVAAEVARLSSIELEVDSRHGSSTASRDRRGRRAGAPAAVSAWSTGWPTTIRPAAATAKRYEDVEELLDGRHLGADVDQPRVHRRTAGVRQRRHWAQDQPQTVPQEFIDRADEVVVVDAPPEAATSERGAAALAASPARAAARPPTSSIGSSRRTSGCNGIQSTWGTQERILVCMTPRANAAPMLASGRRNADRFHGELFADLRDAAEPDRRRIASALGAERDAGARAAGARRHPGGQGSRSARFSSTRARTASRRSSSATTCAGRGARGLTGSLLDRLIRDAEGIDVRVFPH